MTKLEELSVRLACAIAAMNTTVNTSEDDYVKRAWGHFLESKLNYEAALKEAK